VDDARYVHDINHRADEQEKMSRFDIESVAGSSR
jgi:hypothetical protein